MCCVWELILCLISCLWGKREIHNPFCVENIMAPPSMRHDVALKMWSVQRNVTFDSADWSWLLYNQCTHTQLCAHTLILPFQILGLCVCQCVINPHLFHIEGLLLQRLVEELPFTSRSIWRLLLSGEGMALVLVIHERKLQWLCGTGYLYVGGLALSNHTLHSFARNLIT